MGSQRADVFTSGGVPCNVAKDRKTILFVDDQLVILEMRRLIFESLGYTVLVARSERAALALMRRHHVDAVVIEHLLPGADGVETARHIRELDTGVPIISSSGSNQLPPGLRSIVKAAAPKGDGPEALIEVLYEQLWDDHDHSSR